jgi:Holliday junction resolvase RusA-like endonuclease
VYDPAKSREWKRWAAVCYAAAMRKAKRVEMDGPISFTVTAFFRCPRACRDPHSIRKITLPDCDNLAKSAMDAGNGILYVDDAQVAELHVYKWYGYPGQEPFVEVTVRELEA